mgnify:CR=1 FL=1
MINFIVIGICILLLLAVVYISAKPISMGIESRRNLEQNKNNDEIDDSTQSLDFQQKKNISEEIIQLNKLKTDGLISEEEYQKAKKKILD